MMKAFAKRSADDQQLGFVRVPRPEPSATELLVRVEAIGVGIHDGYFFPRTMRYPYVIGIEAAGVVDTVGSAVSGFQPGDRVSFVSAMQPKGGTWAEYAVVDASGLIARVPDGMSFEQAATVPVAGNTILRAFSVLRLGQGDSLFIAGGSGAIGSLAIQLAVSRGYKVLASASARNHEYMRSLGADFCVDYNDPDWPAQVLAQAPGGVDAAIGINPGTAAAATAVVKDGGMVVPISGDPFSPERGIEVQQLPYTVDVRKELQELMNRAASGDLKLVIEKVYPFAQAAQALAKTQTRSARGKVVVSMTAAT